MYDGSCMAFVSSLLFYLFENITISVRGCMKFEIFLSSLLLKLRVSDLKRKEKIYFI